MSLSSRFLHALHKASAFIIVLFFFYNRLLLQHDDIIIDFEYAGAKVMLFPEVCKETGEAGQNLICNVLILSRLLSHSAAEIPEILGVFLCVPCASARE